MNKPGRRFNACINCTMKKKPSICADPRVRKSKERRNKDNEESVLRSFLKSKNLPPYVPTRIIPPPQLPHYKEKVRVSSSLHDAGKCYSDGGRISTRPKEVLERIGLSERWRKI